MLDTPFPALVRYSNYAGLASFDKLGYNAITVGFPLLAFGSILVAMGANYAWRWLLKLGSQGNLIADRVVVRETAQDLVLTDLNDKSQLI